jgi:hypothetical protein
MIKARPCAGDLPLGDEFMVRLRPYIWRKYLDFAAIADVQSLKRQIHAVKGHGIIAVNGHNVKLGRGGIREIEFFVQTQQLIAGGRNPQLLRSAPSTCSMPWLKQMDSFRRRRAEGRLSFPAQVNTVSDGGRRANHSLGGDGSLARLARCGLRHSGDTAYPVPPSNGAGPLCTASTCTGLGTDTGSLASPAEDDRDHRDPVRWVQRRQSRYHRGWHFGRRQPQRRVPV